MTAMELETRANDFLAQERIAIAGVSRDHGRHPVGNLIYRRLKGLGRQVFAVNPGMRSFEGDPCYAGVQTIPGGVDGVVIITRPEVTERIVQDCNAAGVHRVWMHQGLDQRASSVSRQAVAYCRDHDIDVIAGACPMMYGPGVDFGHACMRWMLGVAGKLPS